MSQEAEPIVCRVTPWYHKRRIAMLLMLFGFAAAFFYDWRIGYPLKKEAAAAWNALPEATREREYEVLARDNGWPEKIDGHKDWDYAIKEQLVCALIALGGGTLLLLQYIRTVRSSLTADAVSFTPPSGRTVPFAAAYRIDRRKWDHKGLAYVFYKDDQGRERRAVIDDLVFGGAVKVLDRLQANFQGEVIDLEKKEAPPAEETAPVQE